MVLADVIMDYYFTSGLQESTIVSVVPRSVLLNVCTMCTYAFDNRRRIQIISFAGMWVHQIVF